MYFVQTATGLPGIMHIPPGLLDTRKREFTRTLTDSMTDSGEKTKNLVNRMTDFVKESRRDFSGRVRPESTVIYVADFSIRSFGKHPEVRISRLRSSGNRLRIPAGFPTWIPGKIPGKNVTDFRPAPQKTAEKSPEKIARTRTCLCTHACKGKSRRDVRMRESGASSFSDAVL